MQEKFLIINESSSALKFSLYEMPEYKEIVNLNFEKIGNKLDYEIIIQSMLNKLLNNKLIESLDEIKGVGYKVLYNGIFFENAIDISEEETDYLSTINPLNITNKRFINYVKFMLPNATHTAVFDSAFHKTIHNSNFILNKKKSETHGLSHKYITQYMKKLAVREDIDIINCYIDKDASICAIKEGKSNYISLSLTPLECLVIDKNTNNLEPSIIEFISDFKNISIDDAKKIIRENNLKNISDTNDIKSLLELSRKGNKIARITIDKFTNFITKNIFTSFAKLNGEVNAIIITANIGENSKEFRKIIMDKLTSLFDIFLDESENKKIGKYNEHQCGVISTNNSIIPVFVIPTNEELIILEETYKLSKKDVLVKKLITNK